MRINIEDSNANAFNIMGLVRTFLKETKAPKETIELVSKKMYNAESYEVLLTMAVLETMGWLKIYKDDEPYLIFEDLVDFDPTENFNITFTPDFDLTPNEE